MKKWLIILFLILFSPCLYQCTNSNRITIHGKLFHPGKGYIYLELLTKSGVEKIDSVQLDKQKNFDFSVHGDSSEIYRINFFQKQKNYLTLDSGDIWVEADGNVSTGRFIGKGSQEIELISKAYQLVNEQDMQSALLKEKIRTAQSKNDTISFHRLKNEFEILTTKFQNELKNLIRGQEGSLASLLLLYDNFPIEPNIDFYDECLPAFEKQWKKHWFYQQVYRNYEDIKMVSIGSVAPDFDLPDPNGKIIKLSSFQGKYVYLDFWASWCQPCRIENPDLEKVYEKYKGSQFEILGISLDRSKEYWLKAINDDGLDWIHVSDLLYFDSPMIELYNITFVPTTMLLDPQGRIVAKNIHYNELEAILGSIL